RRLRRGCGGLRAERPGGAGARGADLCRDAAAELHRWPDRDVRGGCARQTVHARPAQAPGLRAVALPAARRHAGTRPGRTAGAVPGAARRVAVRVEPAVPGEVQLGALPAGGAAFPAAVGVGARAGDRALHAQAPDLSTRPLAPRRHRSEEPTTGDGGQEGSLTAEATSATIAGASSSIVSRQRVNPLASPYQGSGTSAPLLSGGSDR